MCCGFFTSELVSNIQHLQKNPTMSQKPYMSANTPVVPKNASKGNLTEHGDACKSNISRTDETHNDSWKHNFSNFEAQMQQQSTEHKQSGAARLPNNAGKTAVHESGGELDMTFSKCTVKEKVESCTKSSKDTHGTGVAKSKSVLTDAVHKQPHRHKASQSDGTQLPKQSKLQQKTNTRHGEANTATRHTAQHHREATKDSRTLSTIPNRKAGVRKPENVPTRVTVQKTLPNMLHVEFMEQTPFAGNGILPLTSDSADYAAADYAASGFAHELKGILNERLMTSHMSDHMKEFLSRIRARPDGVGDGDHAGSVQLYEAEMQTLRQCSDEEVNERLERMDTFSQKNKLSIGAFDEHQKSQQLMFNAEAAAFVDVCVHTGLVSMRRCRSVITYLRNIYRRFHNMFYLYTLNLFLSQQTDLLNLQFGIILSSYYTYDKIILNSGLRSLLTQKIRLLN